MTTGRVSEKKDIQWKRRRGPRASSAARRSNLPAIWDLGVRIAFSVFVCGVFRFGDLDTRIAQKAMRNVPKLLIGVCPRNTRQTTGIIGHIVPDIRGRCAS